MRWDTPPNAVFWACWAAMALVWLAGVTLNRRRSGSRSGRASGNDIASVVGALAGVAAFATPESIWRPITADSPWIRLPGAALLCASPVGTIWARVTLGAMWSSAAATKRRHELRTSGPYQVTRHPIYTGVLGMLAGSTLIEGLGRWTALSIAVTLVLLAKIRAEERLLSEEFPTDYESYRRRVPQLVPSPPRLAGRR